MKPKSSLGQLQRLLTFYISSSSILAQCQFCATTLNSSHNNCLNFFWIYFILDAFVAEFSNIYDIHFWAMVLWFHIKSCLEWTSNPGPCAYYGRALTTELSDQKIRESNNKNTFKCWRKTWRESYMCIWPNCGVNIHEPFLTFHVPSLLIFDCIINLDEASLAKWLSVRLRTKWLWVRVPLQSLKLQISRLFRARCSLTFRQL